MRASDEEELEAAGVEAGVHLQRHRPRRCSRPADRAQSPAHFERSPSGARSVVVAVVQQQQRIASELEQSAAFGVRDIEQRREGRIHDVGHLLGTGAANVRQPLRHRREAGDVDERDCPVRLEPPKLRILLQPLDGDPRNERDEFR